MFWFGARNRQTRLRSPIPPPYPGWPKLRPTPCSIKINGRWPGMAETQSNPMLHQDQWALGIRQIALLHVVIGTGDQRPITRRTHIDIFPASPWRDGLDF